MDGVLPVAEASRAAPPTTRMATTAARRPVRRPEPTRRADQAPTSHSAVQAPMGTKNLQRDPIRECCATYQESAVPADPQPTRTAMAHRAPAGPGSAPDPLTPEPARWPDRPSPPRG